VTLSPARSSVCPVVDPPGASTSGPEVSGAITRTASAGDSAGRRSDRRLLPAARPDAVRSCPRWVPSLLAGVFFALYATVSVTRHLHLRSSGYDLGIFEQAVRAYAQLKPPVAPLKGDGYNLLGDHFHPVLMLLAPFYRLFPSPLTLVVAQAALMAVSVIPVTRVAIRAAGPWFGVAVGVAYGLSWGIQQAVAFDFHEIAFAVPLLAFSLEGLSARRWGTAVAWAFPLVLVKEDLPATVAAIGIYVMLSGRRRLGAGVTTAAAVAGLFIVLVLIPYFNIHGHYDYGHLAAGTGGDPVTRLLLPPVKLGTVLLVLAPTAFLALRSPLAWLAVPTLGWRFWSVNPHYWGIDYHYSAVLMPIVFIALSDAMVRLDGGRLLRSLPVSRAAVAGVTVVGVALATLPALPAWELTGAAWRSSPWQGAAGEVLAAVPDGARIGVTNNLAPQLTGRAEVLQFPSALTACPRPEWLLVSDPDRGGMPVGVDEQTHLPAIPAAGYGLVLERSGIELFRRQADTWWRGDQFGCPPTRSQGVLSSRF